MLDDFFSNGNVYVIDDQWHEAKPLLQTLYKCQLPHVYMDGSASNLPKSPKQVRLLFLDLNLVPGLNPSDSKTFMNKHAGILERLLANQSGSYIVLVWSKQEDTFLEDFKKIFVDKAYKLEDKKPLDIISLQKGVFFRSNNSEAEEPAYSWIEGKEEDLIDLIESKLNENEGFRALTSWERLITISGGKTVDSLVSLSKDSKSDIEKKDILNDIVTNLSVSLLGKKNFDQLEDNHSDKTNGFMLALSELIDDEIDKEILLKTQPQFEKWTTKRLGPELKAKLNSKLLTSIEKTKPSITGSVFEVDLSKHNYLEMLEESIKKDSTEFKKKCKSKFGQDFDFQDTLKISSYIDELFQDSLKSNKLIPIEINLTPLCDVVQNKEKYYRMVPGFLLEAKLATLIDQNSDRTYISPILYKDFGYRLILDFRYLTSVKKEEIECFVKIMGLRKAFVDEIQLKLSNHVSRLGILYLS
tara:strand:+ start:81491 stop:82900 length:1410 start_codon:yes stop_codon:yes gene_type:complete